MTDTTSEQNPYEHWLAERRDVSPPVNLTDQIMSQVVDFENHRQSIWWLLLVEQIERSRAARWAICCAALAIGAVPYLVLAHVPSF